MRQIKSEKFLSLQDLEARVNDGVRRDPKDPARLYPEEIQQIVFEKSVGSAAFWHLLYWTGDRRAVW
jgi:hypothetical protein